MSIWHLLYASMKEVLVRLLRDGTEDAEHQLAEGIRKKAQYVQKLVPRLQRHRGVARRFSSGHGSKPMVPFGKGAFESAAKTRLSLVAVAGQVNKAKRITKTCL